MKVLFVVGIFPKLSETFVLNQITSFIDTGIDVSILAFTKAPPEDKVHDDVYKYQLIEKTTYCNTPLNKKKRVYEAFKFWCHLVVTKPNLAFDIINAGKYGKSIWFLEHFAAVKTLLGKPPTKYDVIISHFGQFGNLAVKLRDFRLVSGKLLTIFHGYDVSSYIKKHGDKIYSYLFAHGDYFLPISNTWKKKLTEMNCPEEKMQTLHMGVDLTRFFFQPLSFDKQNIRLLSVARLTEKKGIEYAIRSVKILLDKGLNVSYRVVGEGPLKSKLEELVYELNLAKNVSFVGICTQQEVVAEMQRSTIFVLPSITSSDGEMEGIPVVLMEAMALGKIVISTRHSGIPELVMDGKNGFLARERSHEEIASIVLKLSAMDNERIKQISLAARGYVESNFEIRALNRKMLSLINDKLIKQPSTV